MSVKTSSKKSGGPSADTDVDRYIQESVKSYKECNVKNNARRNSLQKKTLTIESERRFTSAKLSREERQLKEQLKQMNIEKAKNHIIHSLRDPKAKKKPVSGRTKKVAEHHIPTEPYPVTFITHDDGSETHLDDEGKHYAAHRRRRQSREFEDLSLNTHSGSLFRIQEQDDDEGPRRRVYSMSTAQRILGRGQSNKSNPSTPRHSPSIRRKNLGHSRGGNSSNSSKESMNGSSERITSLDDLHWIGEPEAIHSVRRPRRTVEEQELESELHRLRVS